MKLLAIDTCSEVCSVSLYFDNRKINRFVQGVEKSAGLILSLCDEVFSDSKLKTCELDGIIYTQGPGSFTGVRMCVAVVQGIALAHDIPVYGFSTLELIGFSAGKKYQTNQIAIALDARMGEVYWGIYQNQILLEECLKNPNKVQALGQDFIGVGTGWGVYQQTLSEQTGITEYQADFYPKAQNLIDLYLSQTQHKFNNKLPLPTYLRNNVAHKSLK